MTLQDIAALMAPIGRAAVEAESGLQPRVPGALLRSPHEDGRHGLEEPEPGGTRMFQGHGSRQNAQGFANGRNDFGDHRRVFAHHLPELLRPGCARVAGDDLRPQEVGGHAFGVGAAALEHLCRARDAAGKLLQQAALAEAGLADDREAREPVAQHPADQRQVVEALQERGHARVSAPDADGWSTTARARTSTSSGAIRLRH